MAQQSLSNHLDEGVKSRANRFTKKTEPSEVFRHNWRSKYDKKTDSVVSWFKGDSQELVGDSTSDPLLKKLGSVLGGVENYLMADAVYFFDKNNWCFEKVEFARIDGSEISRKFILNKTISEDRDFMYLVATPRLDFQEPEKTVMEFAIVGRGIAVISQSLFYIVFAGYARKVRSGRISGYEVSSSKKNLQAFLELHICTDPAKPKIEVSLDDPDLIQQLESGDSLTRTPQIELICWYNNFHPIYWPSEIVECILFVTRDENILKRYESIKVVLRPECIDYKSTLHPSNPILEQNFRGY